MGLYVAVIALAAALAFVLGRLAERSLQVAELKQKVQALENRLFTKEGVRPLYTPDGKTIIDTPDDNGPNVSTILPPFAAAELAWENEEEEKKHSGPTLSSFVPPLDPKQQEEILQRYRP